MNKNAKLFIYAAGILITFFYYGIIQEKITRGKYDNDDKFTCILSLVFVQCIFNYAFGKLTSAIMLTKDDIDTTNTWYYVASAFTYLLAMVCSNMSLQWVNYPTQVIGKSGKPIPVMILGVLLGRKSYSLKKYLFVLLIVIGVALFIYKDNKKVVDTGGGSISSIIGLGEILLLISLTMDGLTGAVQERMRSESRTKSGHMMTNMNKWSIVFLGVSLILTGELITFINFVKLHPKIVWEIITFSVASALGQFFIFLTVSEFGPLPCSIVTTTRKFFTVLGSVLFFGNVLLPRQWLATVLVFTGLFCDSFYGKSASKPVSKK